MKKLDLAEAPILVVTKKGVSFEIPEIPAYQIVLLAESLADTSKENIDHAFKILFGEKAEDAKQTITIADLGAIVRARQGTPGPLAEGSQDAKDNQGSPSP